MEYRCVNGACGKTFPRQVGFCPYCGTAQSAAVRAAMPPPPAVAAAASPAVSTAASPAASPAVSPAPVAPSPAAPPQATPREAVRPQATAPAAPVPPARAAQVPPAPAAPPLRKPVGAATWIFVGLFLLTVWFVVKPGNPSARLDKRVDEAVALTEQCRIADARTELVALRRDKASTLQLQRLQGAITGTAPACERKQGRTKAWSEARKAMETALAAGTLDKASTRLSTFTRKWGDDDDTREWRERIDGRRVEKLLDDANACLTRKDRACVQGKLDAAEKLKRPEAKPRIDALREELSRMLESTLLDGRGAAAAPSPAAAAVPSSRVISTGFVAPDAREARRLQQEAERDIAQANYRGAMGKAAQCAALSGGAGDCDVLRERATRLDREYQRCLAAGSQWANERCQ